jgi:lipopolysaccharide/colanic/teichoic acid biosynthesis glycosyltransferase
VNRALDIAIAGAGLVVTSPFLAAGALAVKLQDGGPVLYRQMRVGRDGADFELLKLRTMIVDAEKQGAGFAVDKGDARITKVGRLLRRLSMVGTHVPGWRLPQELVGETGKLLVQLTVRRGC